jgi:hypothetical protein
VVNKLAEKKNGAPTIDTLELEVLLHNRVRTSALVRKWDGLRSSHWGLVGMQR